MKRFEVILNIPSPYRLHMLRAMWRELTARGIAFHAHFMTRYHRKRPDSWRNPAIDFPHTYWRDCGIGERHFNPGYVWSVLRNPPDWLLIGSPYDTFTGILLHLFTRVPVKIAGAEGNTKTPGILSGPIGWFKRRVYATARFASVPGRDAVAYIALHQARTKRRMPEPVIIPNLVDETRFRPRECWPAEEIAATRAALGVGSDERLCLIPARLIPVKGLVPFIERLDPAWLADWRIVIIGQGPLKADILAAAARQGVADRLRILDYVPYDEMPCHYAAADLHLLPSHSDLNPLTVPESLFSALPVALTDQAGNIEEGVTEGRNGWRLPVHDAARFADVLRVVFATPTERLREMGRRSLEENAQFWATEKAVRRYFDRIIGPRPAQH